jgi:myb proto-oncogene protein
MLEDAIDADLDAFARLSAVERTTSSRLGSLADPADGGIATRVRYDASPRNDDFESSLAAHERPMNQKNRHGWTDAEDCTLTALVRRFGCRKWSEVARGLGKRTGKQCRERWNNHVRPDIKRGAWTEAEELLLVDAHTKLGNRWADIAAAIPGRTENAVKNHWNATARRKDAPVAREGSSVVLREHLLRKRLGDEDADVVSYAVGGITERDIAALGLADANDARQTGAKRRRLPGASQMNISHSLMSRSVSRSLRDDGGGGERGRRGCRRSSSVASDGPSRFGDEPNARQSV